MPSALMNGHSTRSKDTDANGMVDSERWQTEAGQNDSIPSHPLGVKPKGNQYLFGGVSARKFAGIWGPFPDEILMVILEYFEKSSLLQLAHTCKFLYAFCHSEELWKALFLQYVRFRSCFAPSLDIVVVQSLVGRTPSICCL